MRKIFMIAAALCATILMAEPTMAAENTVKPSKKEIRAKVVEEYESMMACVDAKCPVALMVEVHEFYEWTESLDEKSYAQTFKEVDRWMKKNEDTYGMYSEYIDAASDVIIFEDFDDNDPKLTAFVYLDTVAEWLMYDDKDTATQVYVDFVIYLYMVSQYESTDGFAMEWTEYNPDGADVIAAGMDTYNEQTFMKYVGAYFDEDYTTMSQKELMAAYITHLEGIADSYEDGTMMDTIRHYLVLTHIVELVENGELMEQMSSDWEENNPERADLVYEALGNFAE